ncbi:hypothetical protein JJB07_00625 [Tumebacillus sp. ITR2]|uniref:Uncharacterized protein n=1 Tax=Tumebacillus amylolyticus TaxID=2801339 RepID=A0ABS1J4D6_9BACL|nr:hypothetical protein [Tumebacillus amylolyticus]MBL0385135.1 hypothetical protein [Tumebacillus amylolyticus]
MNKKMKNLITCMAAVMVVTSVGIAWNSTNKVFAATTSQAQKGCPGGTDNTNTRPPSPPSPTTNPVTNSVVISGGYETDPRDKGRPVVLIASALGVPTEVFREAFSGVTPSGLDSPPSPELARKNKAALLKVLAPYGITNERLDEVSNFYRYNGKQSKTWQVTPATATPIVTNGVVTGVTITNPGAGYSSAPTVTITGPNGTVTATATISYTKDFATNGSISSITINKK